MSEHRRISQRRRRQMEEERRRQEERLREEERRRKIARAKRRRQVIRRRRMLAAGSLLILILAAAVVGRTVYKRSQVQRQQQETEKQQAEEAAAQAETENNTLHIVAVGDNLIHDAFIEAGSDNDWDFDFLYDKIKDDISEADLASVNQETPLTADHDEAAGYPDFNTPSEVGDALADAGFDIITQATEHAFDQGETGIEDTISFWEDNHKKVTLLGIHDRESDSRYQIIEEKNFKIAVMNYSTMLSENHSIPDDASYMVDTYSEENIKEDLEQAKEEADVSIVYLHGGQDDSVEPEERLKERVQFLAEQGADVVICSHPHILKVMRKLKDRTEKKRWYTILWEILSVISPVWRTFWEEWRILLWSKTETRSVSETIRWFRWLCTIMKITRIVQYTNWKTIQRNWRRSMAYMKKIQMRILLLMLWKKRQMRQENSIQNGILRQKIRTMRMYHLIKTKPTVRKNPVQRKIQRTVRQVLWKERIQIPA